MVVKNCSTCKHNVDMSEAELYGATAIYGTGKIFDWCEEYDEPIERIMDFEPDLDDCEKWEEE